jgi:hypothetical protein
MDMAAFEKRIPPFYLLAFDRVPLVPLRANPLYFLPLIRRTRDLLADAPLRPVCISHDGVIVQCGMAFRSDPAHAPAVGQYVFFDGDATWLVSSFNAIGKGRLVCRRAIDTGALRLGELKLDLNEIPFGLKHQVDRRRWFADYQGVRDFGRYFAGVRWFLVRYGLDGRPTRNADALRRRWSWRLCPRRRKRWLEFWCEDNEHGGGPDAGVFFPTLTTRREDEYRKQVGQRHGSKGDFVPGSRSFELKITDPAAQHQ